MKTRYSEVFSPTCRRMAEWEHNIDYMIGLAYCGNIQLGSVLNVQDEVKGSIIQEIDIYKICTCIHLCQFLNFIV